MRMFLYKIRVLFKRSVGYIEEWRRFGIPSPRSARTKLTSLQPMLAMSAMFRSFFQSSVNVSITLKGTDSRIIKLMYRGLRPRVLLPTSENYYSPTPVIRTPLGRGVL